MCHETEAAHFEYFELKPPDHVSEWLKKALPKSYRLYGRIRFVLIAKIHIITE